MSQLVCPLCGRFVSLRFFDPSNFEDDIYAVEVRGLGRGKGVEVSEKYSVLGTGSEAIDLLKDRIIDIVSMLIRSGDMEPDELVSNLNLPSSTKSSRTVEERGSLAAYCEELEQDLKVVKIKAGKIADRIYKEIEYEENGEEDPMQRLEEAVDALLEDYDAAVAGAEEEEDEEEKDPRIAEMTSAVAEALGEDPEIDWGIEEWGDEVEVLRMGLDRLIEDYEASVAMQE